MFLQFLHPCNLFRAAKITNTYSTTSAKNISVRAGRLRQSGRAPSEPSETPRWRITPHPVSIPRVALHIALQSLFHRFFSLCRSPILNQHSGVGANCDHTLEWVHWVHACIWNAMHQQKTFPSGRTGCVRMDALRQSRQRHPGGGLLRARRQYHASSCISPSDRCVNVSTCSVGLLF